MEIKKAISCPLGSKCEEVRDNTLYQCAWFVQMAGQDPSTGESIDRKGCAMSWMPVLMVENSRQQVRTTAAVESFREETVKANSETRQMMVLAAALQRPAGQMLTTTPGPSENLIGGD